MLDLNHPQSKHIFRAARLLDGLLECSHRMSVSPSIVRAELLPKALSRISDLRVLAAEHFARLTLISPALDELIHAFTVLANRGEGKLIVGATDGNGPCPACAGDITKFDAMVGTCSQGPQWVIFCAKCTDEFSQPFLALDSDDGFSTMFI